MAISVPQINTAVDTFGTWITKFNTVANIISTQTVTADFTNVGSETTGNVHVNGYFTAVNTYITNTLYGGNPVNTAPVNVGVTLNVTPGIINSAANSTVSLVNLTTNDTVSPETLNFSAVRTVSGNTPQTVSFKIQSRQSNSYIQFDPLLANGTNQINAVGLGVGNNLGFYVTSNTVVVVNPITLQNTNISLLTVDTTNANVTNSINVTSNLITSNTANVINVESSSVNTNFLTANTTESNVLNANSASITNLVTSNASIDVHSSNNITSNVFYAASNQGYQFVNSAGRFFMDANNAFMYLPANGSLYIRDPYNGSLNVKVADAVVSNDAVSFGQSNRLYANKNGLSTESFSANTLTVTQLNGYRWAGTTASLYADANNITTRVPVGGALYVQDVNGNTAPAFVANATANNHAVNLGQADSRYANTQGSSTQSFNTSGLNLHTGNSSAGIYTAANTNNLTFLTGAANNYNYTVIHSNGQLQARSFIANEGATFNGNDGYSFAGDGGFDTGMFSSGDGYVQFYSNQVLTATIQIDAHWNFAESPYVPTPGAGDNSTVVPNTSWFRNGAMAAIANALGFKASLGNPGYIKLPNYLGNLMIEWGQATNNNGSITLPWAFGTILAIQVTPANGGGGNFTAGASFTGNNTQINIGNTNTIGYSVFYLVFGIG